MPYFDDEFIEGEQRAARDPETGKTVYVDDMSYKEWEEKYLKNGVETEEKSSIIKVRKTTKTILNYIY